MMSDLVSTNDRPSYTADVSDYSKMKSLLCPEDTVQTVTDELSIGSPLTLFTRTPRTITSSTYNKLMAFGWAVIQGLSVTHPAL